MIDSYERGEGRVEMLLRRLECSKTWRWAAQPHSKVIFLTFDVKYPPSDADRTFSCVSVATTATTIPLLIKLIKIGTAEVFPVHVESLTNYVAIIPRKTVFSFQTGSKSAGHPHQHATELGQPQRRQSNATAYGQQRASFTYRRGQ